MGKFELMWKKGVSIGVGCLVALQAIGAELAGGRWGMGELPIRQCSERLATQTVGQLLGVVVGGRATGNQLQGVGQALGFRTVHLFPEGLSESIRSSFSDQFDYPPIVYGSLKEVSQIASQVRKLAETHGLKVAGFVAGMDYGADVADALNALFGVPGNTPNTWRSNKGRLNERLRARNVPVVQSQILPFSEVAQGIGERAFPLFLKPASSFASIGAGCCDSRDQLSAMLDRMLRETQSIQHAIDEVVVQDFLHPDTVYFVNTINARIHGQQKRIVTGVALDSRGDAFPKEVWDFIVQMPPPHLLDEKQQRLFHHLLAANSAVLEASEVTVGSSHLEFMARAAQPNNASDFLPIDLNLRLPGLDLPTLELRATGVDPYVLDITSHTFPDLLKDFPEVYSSWRQAVALIFLRSHKAGRVSERGLQWLHSLLEKPNARADRAYLTRVMVAPAGTPVVRTTNGSSMQGVVHVVAPTLEGLRSLYNEIREREQAGYFVD